MKESTTSSPLGPLARVFSALWIVLKGSLFLAAWSLFFTKLNFYLNCRLWYFYTSYDYPTKFFYFFNILVLGFYIAHPIYKKFFFYRSKGTAFGQALYDYIELYIWSCVLYEVIMFRAVYTKFGLLFITPYGGSFKHLPSFLISPLELTANPLKSLFHYSINQISFVLRKKALDAQTFVCKVLSFDEEGKLLESVNSFILKVLFVARYWVPVFTLKSYYYPLYLVLKTIALIQSASIVFKAFVKSVVQSPL